MNADHYFTIGAPHVSQGTPCEDYALSGRVASPDVALAVVCDGCGGAYADTDVGARVLAHTFRHVVLQQARARDWLREDFFEALLVRFKATQFTARAQDNFATLVGLVATPETAQGLVIGDGAFGLRYTDGRRELIEAEWADNTPLYLAYHDDEDALGAFRARTWAVDAPFTLRRTEFVMRDGEPEVLAVRTQALSFAAAARGVVLDFFPERDGIEALAVLTDGITRVGPGKLAALGEALAFKNHEGSFVKRRLGKAVQRFTKDGQPPQDDLAMACIWFGNKAGEVSA